MSKLRGSATVKQFLVASAFVTLLGLANAAHAQSATNAITFNNKMSVTANPSSLNVAGTLSKMPVSVPALATDSYIETGIGAVTSFHINYTAASGGKQCHFDSASFPNTGGGCTFTKGTQSQGTTFATCTAKITSFNETTCSMSVTFSMQ